MTRLWLEGEAVDVWGEEETPTGFVWRGASHRIEKVWNRWQIHTRWWEAGQAVWREYLKATTDTGLLCLLYQDLMGGGWFVARVYD